MIRVKLGNVPSGAPSFAASFSMTVGSGDARTGTRKICDWGTVDRVASCTRAFVRVTALGTGMVADNSPRHLPRQFGQANSPRLGHRVPYICL